MKNYLILGFLVMLGLSSCDSSVQYGVMVQNSTKESITVVFKSPVDITNTDEQTIVLPAGTKKQIITTSNMEIEASSGTTADHCSEVAEYVKAFIKDTLPSKVKWCDKDIRFQKEDIGQAMFTIEYTTESF